MSGAPIEVNVKTNEFAIGLPGEHRLYTQFITTCTAVMGVDPESGVTFLCHLNTPMSAFALPEIVGELRTHVPDISGFRLYTLGGIHPLYRWIASPCLGLAAWHWHAGVFLSIVLACVPLFFDLTRASFRLQLRRLGAFANKPISLGYSTVRGGSGRTDVSIDESNRSRAPWKRSYVSDAKDKEFGPKSSCWTEMTKAEGSAPIRTAGHPR